MDTQREMSLFEYVGKLPNSHRAVQEYKKLAQENHRLKEQLRKKNRKWWQKRYPSLSWWENFMGGDISIGRFTFFGENAMHWGVVIQTETFGYICFRLPFRCFGRWWPLYFYTSPNATPWASTFYRGPDKKERLRSVERRKKYGFRYDTNLLSEGE